MTEKINVLEKKKNPVLGREEIIFEIEHQKTPSFTETEHLIHEELKTDKGAIAVKEIRGIFGSRRFRIKAFLYDSPENKEKIEPKKKEKKKVGEIKEEKEAKTG